MGSAGIYQNMVEANELYRKYQLLCDMRAAGATEDQDAAKIEAGHQMFENFRGGRRLRHVTPYIESLPWLYRSRIGSKKWEETCGINPPFRDHARHFVDRDTKERIFTIQPYLLTVAKTDEFGAYSTETLDVSKEFVEVMCAHVNASSYKPLPNTPLVHGAVQKVLDKAKDCLTQVRRRARAVGQGFFRRLVQPATSNFDRVHESVTELQQAVTASAGERVVTPRRII